MFNYKNKHCHFKIIFTQLLMNNVHWTLSIYNLLIADRMYQLDSIKFVLSIVKRKKNILIKIFYQCLNVSIYKCLECPNIFDVQSKLSCPMFKP